MNTVIFGSGGLRIRSYGCEPGAFCPPVETRAPWHSLLFVRRGMFLKTLRGETFVADVNKVTFFNRGERYDVQYRGPHGDRITELEIEDGFLDAIASSFDCAADGMVRRPFDMPYQMIDPGVAQHHHYLWRLAIDRHRHDPLCVQETAINLIGALLATARVIPDRARRRAAATSRAHSALSREVQLVLNDRFNRQLTLGGIAEAVGASQFHLCRVFAKATGATVHGYLNNLRLRAAMARLSDGGSDLSRIALQHGFSSHSHFTTAFKRAFGMVPSRWRRQARPPVRTGSRAGF